MRKILIAISIVITTSGLFGQPREGVVYQFPDRSYAAAINSNDFKFAASKQLATNWCWAACIQMILRYQGLNVTQEDVVNRAYGRLLNHPANCDVITNAANNWQHNGKVIRTSKHFTAVATDLVDDLAHRYPIIVGLNMPNQPIGHAYVLTAIYYRRDSYGRIIPDKVGLRDPWPGNPSMESLNLNEFASRINCIVRVTF